MMKKSGIILMLAMLILTASACHHRMTNGDLPLPKLAHGWSPVRIMELNGKQEIVQCMTIEDKRKLTEFLLIYEAQAGAK